MSFSYERRQELSTAYMPVTTAMMRAGGVSGPRNALEEQARAKVSRWRTEQDADGYGIALSKCQVLAAPATICAGKTDGTITGFGTCHARKFIRRSSGGES